MVEEYVIVVLVSWGVHVGCQVSAAQWRYLPCVSLRWMYNLCGRFLIQQYCTDLTLERCSIACLLRDQNGIGLSDLDMKPL
jgi:hypothetical protein